MKKSFGLAALSLLLVVSCSQVKLHDKPQILTPRPSATPEGTATEEASTVAVPPPVDTKGINPLDIPGKNAPGYTNPYPKGSYEHFAARPAYPETLDVYTNDELLRQLTASNSKIVVCLPQQRARIYVNGKVACDWPVSTGIDGHETPTGVFRVIEKEKDHKSNRYGKFINSRGRTVNSNADNNKGIPEGCTFRPASMPNWHRLTWDGVGIHGGRVVAGRRLSHGCIRSPYRVVAKLYEHTVLGMPAYISRAVEDYNRGGAVKPIDVKYRPKAGNDYTDMAPAQPPRP